MKKICLFLLFLMTFPHLSQAKGLYEYTLQSTGEKDLQLKDYKGKAILFVNIATRCGYTGQLDGLEKVYQKYKKNLMIIGIPSNDFGGQTPEDNKGVKNFCKIKYGVTFPLSKKAVITGNEKSELYKFFLDVSDKEEIQWNFTKFLFDKKGKFVKRYGSSISPSDDLLITDIKKAIN